ncbi:hypothetical protein [Croceimicrobium sp.]|uniref:hypothetical protein n=1 Tax=Croceimicrobium sp. TaxID=2828340 RepID=UPI003BAA20B5
MQRTAFIIRVLNPEKPGFQDSKDLTEEIFKPICENLNIVAKDASDFNKTGRISEQVLQAIRDSDIVFADANSNNENVWFEMGYCLRENPEKLIYLFKESRKIPFDVADFRGVSYSNTVGYFRRLEHDITLTIREILIKSDVNRLLKAKDWKNELQNFQKLDEGTQSLVIAEIRKIFNNISRAIETRKRAIIALSHLDQLDYNELMHYLGGDTDDGLRVVIIESFRLANQAVSDEIWAKIISKDQRFPILRAAAKSGAIQYNKGLISKDRFNEIFLDGAEWVVLKHIAIIMLENLNAYSNSLIILRKLLKDNREEIYNRFLDWWYEIKDTPLTENERDLKQVLLESWSNSEVPGKLQIADKLKST